MTTTIGTGNDHRTSDDVLRTAKRAWFRAGVRRGDRDDLAADLTAELSAATTDSLDYSVLGDDPALTARDWARARGLADRRLRLATFVVPALVAGVIASGAVLMMLTDAFAGDGRTVLSSPSAAAILAVYTGSGVISAAAIVGVTGLVLWAQDDRTARRTVRSTCWLLPPGAIAAVAGGVLTARAFDFSTEPRTFVLVGGVVVVILIGTLTLARWLAVRRHHAAQILE